MVPGYCINAIMRQQILIFFLYVASTLSSECPRPCTCSNFNNLTITCSGLHLVKLPATPLSTLTLDLSNNALGPIMNSSFVQMWNLTHLDLSHNGLTRLLGCSFSGMLDLRTVVLHSNKLTSLPDSLFTDSNKVDHLDISHNLMKELPDEVFRNLPALKVLNVSHNQIVNLKLGNRFQIPRNLQVLDLSYNQITAVNRDSFEAASGWSSDVKRSINLAFCQITSMEDDSFTNIPSIQDLELSGNSGVPWDSLVNVVKEVGGRGLARLSLAHMNIDTVSSLFSQETEFSLTFLNLSFNRISDVPASTFSTVRQLQILDLSRNHLTSFGEGFSSLSSLIVLNVSQNMLESFEGDSVLQLTNLLTLDLSGNKLADSARVNVSPLTSLRYLNVSSNLLNAARLPTSTANLRVIDYHSNKITDFRALDNAENLEVVDLSDNNIRSVGSFLFKGARLVKLVNFSKNNITFFDHQAFLPQSSLVIDLSHNFLKELRFFHWVATQRLYLSHNELSKIDDQAFYGMSGLEVLDLSHNKLTTIHEDLLQYLNNLKSLNLSHNQLDIVQWFSAFRGLELLVTLDLGYNNIIRLNDSMFLPLPKIQSLTLSHNRLQIINPKLFRDLADLKYLDISSNPFDCGCGVLGLREWLKKTQILVPQLYDMNYTGYRCRTPSHRFGMHIFNWSTEEFECDKTLLYVIAFCGTLLVLTVITLIGCSVYRTYTRWNYRRLERRRKLAEEEEERKKLIKKVDFLRTFGHKASVDNWDVKDRMERKVYRKNEDRDTRNGYVNNRRLDESERKKNRIDKGKEDERNAGDGAGRGGGRHYEILKRKDMGSEENERRRRNTKDDRQEDSEQVELAQKREAAEATIGRGTGEILRVYNPDRRQQELPRKAPSRYEGFPREILLVREPDRRPDYERDPHYRYTLDQRTQRSPYIISASNAIPTHWDNTYSWNIPHGWTGQGYRAPIGHSYHRMDTYSTLPTGRDFRALERENIYRHQPEVHFMNEGQPIRYVQQGKGDQYDRFHPRQRSQSYNYLPQEHKDHLVRAGQSQREYDSIENSSRGRGIGPRASSQPLLASEAVSDWL